MRQTIACLEEEVDDTRLGYQHLLMGQESQLTSLRAELALMQGTCFKISLQDSPDKSSFQDSPHSSDLQRSMPSQPYLTASSPVLCIPASTTSASCQTDTPCSSPSDALATSSILSSEVPSHLSHTCIAMASQTDFYPAAATPAQQQHCCDSHITAVTEPVLVTTSCSQTDAYLTTSAPAQDQCSHRVQNSTGALPTAASTSQTEESQLGIPQSLEQHDIPSSDIESATIATTSPATALSKPVTGTDPCPPSHPIITGAAQQSDPNSCERDAAPISHSRTHLDFPVSCDSATTTLVNASSAASATTAAGTQTADEIPTQVCSTGTQTDQVEEVPLNSR